MLTLNEIDAAKALARASMGAPDPLRRELAFTETFRAHLGCSPARRELACLRVMFPASFLPIEGGDLFAGRVSYPLVGFSCEPGGLGYYCREDAIHELIHSGELSPADLEQARALLDFWRGRTTAQEVRAGYPAELAAVLPSDDWTHASGMAFPLYRMAGTVLDYAQLLKLGLHGLRAVALRSASASDDAGREFLNAAADAIQVVSSSALSCAEQAETGARVARGGREVQLREMASVLCRVAVHPPETLREAIQLLWLYALASGTWNFGRMDVYLGPFLARDLAAGRLDHDRALQLLESLWRLMASYDNQYNNRVIIGGAGRANEAEADTFALLALEATRRVQTNQPQLSLRFTRDQNPALYTKALDVLAEGRTFPLLYNDDVNIPAVMAAFSVARSEAEQYVPFGCGEYVLEHRSVGSPNGVLNLAKCLEVTLHGGRDSVAERTDGLAVDIAAIASFEEFWSAYCAQVERQVAALAVQEHIEYEVTAAQAPFLLLSLLYDDCVARARPLLAGGARYLGGTLETYGNTNAADSLTAIAQLVFEQSACTLTELAAACAANFAGFETLRHRLLTAPKYGNDDPSADGMAVRVHEHVCRVTAAQAVKVRLDSYLVVIINNWANALFGMTTGATPDGRLTGETLANGNNPHPGMDRNGATAFLKSMLKLDPSLHAGAVQNMKFSRSLLVEQRPILEALLNGYFKQGGAQAMLTILDRGDLEAAMREPEKWGHLMVRVGGFSARFIDLPRESQLDLLRRTLY